ncbi:hypothetical protein L6164_012914 [Bauhinia variegata]|uniref:Uncharacterized protein n=1 Tax=Bauhinia variegata TaxID=167791 RepID=A0ACB9PAJ2_BAUVA|nr:hypothetical protein L6164_012914 [Bauhinia variegata]
MGLRDLHLKFKALRLRRFLLGGRGKRRENGSKRKPSWMMPISHGSHVVEHNRIFSSDDSGCDSIVVQREEIEGAEVWYFGIFDALIGDAVTNFMQSHFFDKKLKESHIRRRGQEALKRAYLSARSKIREEHKPEETRRMGSASAIVINGEKLVIANMGDYRAVVCRDGVAHNKITKHQQSPKRHWCRRLFTAGTRRSKGSELVVGAERINSDTEFLILASNGIWEVMKNQEAVNLIRHIEDPQEAAECLTKEALIRMSKSSISCLIIRFD